MGWGEEEIGGKLWQHCKASHMLVGRLEEKTLDREGKTCRNEKQTLQQDLSENS